MPASIRCTKLELTMYEDFKVKDRWTGEELHCQWKANMVVIATHHARAVQRVGGD